MAKVLELSQLALACDEQLAIVKAEWPNGIPLTNGTAERAVELGLDIDWAAEHLLTATAWAEYERVKAPALAEYERVKATALLAALLADRQ